MKPHSSQGEIHDHTSKMYRVSALHDGQIPKPMGGADSPANSKFTLCVSRHRRRVKCRFRENPPVTVLVIVYVDEYR